MAVGDQRQEPRADLGFSSLVLNIGFIAALLLAALSFLAGAAYLFWFLRATSGALETLFGKVGDASTALEMAVSARLVLARIGLASCGVFVGMAFGFLGFALFLIGVRGDMGVSAQYESAQVRLVRLSPGVFVVVLAVILIGLCITRPNEFHYKDTRITDGATQGATPLDPGKFINKDSPKP